MAKRAAMAAPMPDFRKNMLATSHKTGGGGIPALFQILGGDLEGLSP
jgi:hypothetical protein